MNAGEFNTRLIDAMRLIRAAEQAYHDQIAEWADAERRYKLGTALATTSVGPSKNAGERDAKAETIEVLVAGETTTVNELRWRAHRAENMMNACKLSLQARMAELSALQSEASLAKEEARFLTTAPSAAVGT